MIQVYIFWYLFTTAHIFSLQGETLPEIQAKFATHEYICQLNELDLLVLDAAMSKGYSCPLEYIAFHHVPHEVIDQALTYLTRAEVWGLLFSTKYQTGTESVRQPYVQIDGVM